MVVLPTRSRLHRLGHLRSPFLLIIIKHAFNTMSIGP
jgi:hypothetical protein